ncbi:diol dehydratase small subunit [Thalassobacillus sp. C254]|uniref:diol dehydratase small subunit n=1 Tax=Thalassobacillus sp. C254 TaxID=1225341 RepID=UPI0006D1BE9C|nr:diol dehydratase small subunit [Thalassobacillus sp. C254]
MRTLTREDYPLGDKRTELIKTPTGKTLNELTLQEALQGNISSEDFRISPETLLHQAEIAESLNRDQLGRNFRRAAELINISDQRILEIYNALRPNRSTKDELLTIAEELKTEYEAIENSKLIVEAAEVYERRGLLRQDED